MEYPINSKPRRVAYLKFLLFFIATITTIMVAAHFDVNLPTKENDRLRKEIKTYKNQIVEQEEFSNTIQKVTSLIKSMDSSGQNNLRLTQEINSCFDILNNPRHKANSFFAKSNIDVLNTTYDYYEYTKEITDLKDVNQHFQKDLENSQNKLKEAEDRLEDCKKNSYPGP